jgi:hypothetical protein
MIRTIAKHFHATGHLIIQSFEPGEDWGWCDVDQVGLAFAWPLLARRAHELALQRGIR